MMMMMKTKMRMMKMRMKMKIKMMMQVLKMCIKKYKNKKHDSHWGTGVADDFSFFIKQESINTHTHAQKEKKNKKIHKNKNIYTIIFQLSLPPFV